MLADNIEFLLKAAYDIVFLQEVGDHERGAHSSIKVPATNRSKPTGHSKTAARLQLTRASRT